MDKRIVDQIMRSNPHAWELLTKWYLDQVTPGKTGIEELDKSVTYPQFNMERLVKNLLTFTIPRFLYDFFDYYDVKMFVVEPRPNRWIFAFASQLSDWTDDVDSFTSRIHAEEAGFQEAFRLLENKAGEKAPGND